MGNPGVWEMELGWSAIYPSKSALSLSRDFLVLNLFGSGPAGQQKGQGPFRPCPSDRITENRDKHPPAHSMYQIDSTFSPPLGRLNTARWGDSRVAADGSGNGGLLRLYQSYPNDTP